MNEPSDEMLRHWLLHRRQPQEVEMLEERLLQDEEFAARLRAVETDLLDDFARHRLSDADRDAVASHLGAAPSDRARVHIAVALARIGGPLTLASTHADRHATRPTSLHSSARWSLRSRRAIVGGFLAATCVLVISVIALSRRGAIESTAMPDTSGMVATITLLVDQQRGAQVEQIRIPHGAAKIRLQVEVDATAPQARYTVSIADGARTIFSARDLVPREAAPYHFVEVTLAAQTLADGALEVRVAAQGTSAGESIWSIRSRDE